jgi:hypothetical protein
MSILTWNNLKSIFEEKNTYPKASRISVNVQWTCSESWIQTMPCRFFPDRYDPEVPRVLHPLYDTSHGRFAPERCVPTPSMDRGTTAPLCSSDGCDTMKHIWPVAVTLLSRLRYAFTVHFSYCLGVLSVYLHSKSIQWNQGVPISSGTHHTRDARSQVLRSGTYQSGAGLSLHPVEGYRREHEGGVIYLVHVHVNKWLSKYWNMYGSKWPREGATGDHRVQIGVE